MNDVFVPLVPRISIRAAANMIRAMFVLCALGTLFFACPRMPPPDGCTPGTYSCGPDDRPRYCSQSQRNTPIGDLPCNAQHGMTCVVGNGTAHCELVQSVEH